MSFGKWQIRSFFIEIKPRADYASVFIDCPPVELQNESTNENIILNENSIELRRSTAELFYEHSGEQSGDKSDYSVLYTAHFKNILLRPNTLHAATWADNRRLFMCKIQANLSHNLVPKTIYRLMNDSCSGQTLSNFIQHLGPSSSLKCSTCFSVLHQSSEGFSSFAVQCVKDDWPDFSQNFEYFCDCSCSGSCNGSIHNISNLSSGNHFYPSEKQIFMSDLFLLVHNKMIPQSAIISNDCSIRCAKCNDELGSINKRAQNVYQFHHTSVSLISGHTSYINTRFGCLEHFFAFMVLTNCEDKTSSKLILRSLDKRPRLLVSI
ncbi:unnamed protein product [Dracunculus medinensis]|uniref:E3 ubiquitin-protein ligase E3D n=1 Tax=Dracunculus medinensis TaxID=318479 RepID=A0A0N4U1T0_DRAME|nr:unnamed protein product [Dracunculus medinensis]